MEQVTLCFLASGGVAAKHSHLKEQLPVRSGVNERGSVVVFVQHGDMSGARGAARRRASVLYHHNKLVAGLLLSVQGETGTDLTLTKREQRSEVHEF